MRGLKHLDRKRCMLMCFIGRLVANMGSDFCHGSAGGHRTANGGGWRWDRWFRGSDRNCNFLRKLESSGVNRSADRKRLHHTTRREPRGPAQMGTRFIVMRGDSRLKLEGSSESRPSQAVYLRSSALGS